MRLTFINENPSSNNFIKKYLLFITYYFEYKTCYLKSLKLRFTILGFTQVNIISIYPINFGKNGKKVLNLLFTSEVSPINDVLIRFFPKRVIMSENKIDSFVYVVKVWVTPRNVLLYPPSSALKLVIIHPVVEPSSKRQHGRNK